MKNPERENNDSKQIETVRINTIIKGDPATWLKEWKKRGQVKSNTDAVIQAFILYNEKTQNRDLERQKLEQASDKLY